MKGYSAEVYFDTAAAIIVLILLGRMLRPGPKASVRGNKETRRPSAKTARVVRNGLISGEEVEIGISLLSGPVRRYLLTEL